MTSKASREHSPSIDLVSADNQIRRQSSALHGASHAFFSAPPAPKPKPNTYSGTNGALAAASAVERRRHEEVSGNGTSLHKLNDGTVLSKGSHVPGPSDMCNATRQSSQSREQSPSYAAALLATSRSGTPKSTPPREPTSSSRLVSRLPSPAHGMNRVLGAYGSSPAIDDTPSRATTSLVQLFESKQSTKPSPPVIQSVRYYIKPTEAIASPTPVRPLKAFTTSAMVPLSPFPTTHTTVRDAVPPKAAKPSQAAALAAAAKLASPARLGTTTSGQPANTTRRVPQLPAPRRSGRQSSLDGSVDSGAPNRINSHECRSSVSLLQPAKRPVIARSQTSDGQVTTKTQMRSTSTVLPHSISGDATETFLNNAAQVLQTTPPRLTGASSLPTQRSNPTVPPLRQPSNPLPRPALQPTATSDPARLVRTTTRTSDSYVPQLTVDSLANAMVASSLASSRAPSPSKIPPVPPPRRHGKSYSLFHHHPSQEQISRTPSPAKTMRHTMREPVKSDDETDYKKRRGHIVRKHPNKHHEGDRKRYRNQVTERERKRYEGVWAANRGLLMDAESSHAVINVVVRDIWRRSHLPDDVLEEVWDLVDTQGIGRLEREEFVVGMFLIDSRLKGNKLPFRVSDSLWSSVRRLSGITVPQKRR